MGALVETAFLLQQMMHQKYPNDKNKTLGIPFKTKEEALNKSSFVAKCFTNEHKNNDSSHALSLNDSKQVFKCWVCGISGKTPVDLLVHYLYHENDKDAPMLPLKEIKTNKTLMRKAFDLYKQLNGKEFDFSSIEVVDYKAIEQLNKDKINLINVIYGFLSKFPLDKDCVEYFKNRKLNEETLKDRGIIGLNDKMLKELMEFLNKFIGNNKFIKFPSIENCSLILDNANLQVNKEDILKQIKDGTLKDNDLPLYNKIKTLDHLLKLEMVYPNTYTFNFAKHPVVMPFWDDNKEYITALQFRSIDPEVPKSKRFKGYGPLNIYNLDLLKGHEEIFITEGGSDANTIIQYGYPALSLPGAQFGLHERDLKKFEGKRVYIVGDNDGPGKAFIDKVKFLLSPYVSSIEVISIPEPAKDMNEFDSKYNPDNIDIIAPHFKKAEKKNLIIQNINDSNNNEKVALNIATTSNKEAIGQIEDIFQWILDNKISCFSVNDKSFINLKRCIEFAKSNNIKFIPSITVNFLNEPITIFFSNEEEYKALVNLIVNNTITIEGFNNLPSTIKIVMPAKLINKIKNNSPVAHDNIYSSNDIVLNNNSYIKKDDVVKYDIYKKILSNNKNIELTDLEKEGYIKVTKDNKTNAFVDSFSNLSLDFNFKQGLPGENITISTFKKSMFKLLKEKGFDKNDLYINRLEKELEVLKDNIEFIKYFNLIYDGVKHLKNEGFQPGIGRGSAVSSLILYLMDITGIDPLEYNLLFERFLNKGRKDQPDVDLDLSAKAKKELIRYFSTKYKVAGIKNVTHMGEDGVSSSCKRLFGEIPKVAKELIGEVNNYSSNASATIITDENFLYDIEYNPQLEIPTLNAVLNEIPYFKFDLLNSINMAIIETATSILSEDLFDFNNLDVNDKKILAEFAKGNLDGIPQMKSIGMKNLCKKLMPENFLELSDLLALYRPGTISVIEPYLLNKKLKKIETLKKKMPQYKEIFEESSLENLIHLKVKYKGKFEAIDILNTKIKHLEKPDFEKELEANPYFYEVTKTSNGVIIYQEQIMELLNKLAGLSLDETNDIRKAISKKHKDEIEKIKPMLIKKFVENGKLTEKTAKALYSNIENFAEYAFNKSHSISYALLSFAFMKLKVEYPAVFFLSYKLNKSMSPEELGLPYDVEKNICGPLINYSNVSEYRYAKGKVIKPLLSIELFKYQPEIVKTIMEKGPYTSLADFKTKTRLPQDIIDKLKDEGFFNQQTLANVNSNTNSNTKSKL